MRIRKSVLAAIGLSLILIGALLLLLNNKTTHAQGMKAQTRSIAFQTVPSLISYQGLLTDANNNPIDGTKAITLTVYAVANGGTALWQESHSDVAVNQGAFAILLGTHTPLPENLFNEANRWLEINVEGITLAPRQQFTSVPYALNAEKVGGMNASELSAFPRPAYDSGWIATTRSQPEVITLTHNLGGDVGNYVVDMIARDDSNNKGINIQGFGVVSEFFWFGLTNTDIKINHYGSYASEADAVRIRIWVYNGD